MILIQLTTPIHIISEEILLIKCLPSLAVLGSAFSMPLMKLVKKTLVYVGIDSKGKSILEYSTVNDYGKLAVVEGMASDRVLVQQPSNWFA